MGFKSVLKIICEIILRLKGQWQFRRLINSFGGLFIFCGKRRDKLASIENIREQFGPFVFRETIKQFLDKTK